MTTDEPLTRLTVPDPHTVRAWVAKITAVDTTQGLCTIDPNDGDVVTEVPYWGSAPPVGSVQVALLFDGLLGVVVADQPAVTPDPVELGGGVDLNTLITTGVRTQSQSVEATTALNYPVPMAGLLEVFANPGNAGNTNMTWQRYTVYNGGAYAGMIFARARYNTTWSAWAIIANEPPIPDPLDTYNGADQVITSTVAGTESPTAVRASITNPHPSKKLLVQVMISARVIVSGTSGLIYTNVLRISSSGITTATPDTGTATDIGPGAGQTAAVSVYNAWVDPAITGTFGVAASRSATTVTGTIRYVHCSVTPIRYEG